MVFLLEFLVAEMIERAAQYPSAALIDLNMPSVIFIVPQYVVEFHDFFVDPLQ